jgi:hypothetical protein
MVSQEFSIKESAFSKFAPVGCLIRKPFISSLDGSPKEQLNGFISIMEGINKMSAEEIPQNGSKSKEFRVSCNQLDCSEKTNCILFTKGVIVEDSLNDTDVSAVTRNL